MEKHWLQLLEKYGLLAVREKVMLMACGLIIILFGGYSAMVEPKLVSAGKLEQRHNDQRQELGSLTEEVNTLNRLLEQDPNMPLIERQQRVVQQLADVDEKLRSQTVDLIPADKMSEVLQRILEQSGRVKVVGLETIPPIRMIDANDSETNEQVNLFQHGVKLTLVGNYFDIQNYLLNVENLPWQFYWKNFDYEVQGHPEANLVLEIYTLSTSEDFLGV